ncbi:hypothetical protein ACHAXA_009498 [Cyclostephanos tholiformis]|uniref:Uncharacterized protein n=1 Tax=Cyclostephanos tholiformis TaxID=382380 RepID=A0ABD3RG12_9STRA
MTPLPSANFDGTVLGSGTSDAVNSSLAPAPLSPSDDSRGTPSTNHDDVNDDVDGGAPAGGGGGDADAGPERSAGWAARAVATTSPPPFRGLRPFFYAAFASGGIRRGTNDAIGRIHIADLEMPSTSTSAIDFGAVTAFGVFAKFDLDGAARLDAEVEEKVRRKGELKKLARDMREGEAKMRDLNNEANFAMTNILVVPYETGVDVVDRMTRPDGKGGFGADTRPSYETQPYVAEPMNAAVEQAGEGVRDEGIALVVANDGRVLRRGVGKVPWRQMADELEETVAGEKKKETSVPFLEFLE